MQPWSQPLLWPAPGGAVACDPYFGNVVLLMGYEGVNGSTGAPGMTDESPAAHGTATGLVNATISNTKFRFGSTSLFLNSGRIQFADSNDWNFGAGNFTFELWVNLNSLSGIRRFISTWNGTNDSQLGFNLGMTGAGTALTWQVSTSGANNFVDINAGWIPVINEWYFIALDYDGTKYRAYINGVMVGSSTTARTIFDSTHSLNIGSDNDGTSQLLGYLDELRITKGIARYAVDGTGPAIFNSSDQAILSNNNRTATSTLTTVGGARSYANKSSGKWYFETTITTATNGFAGVEIITPTGTYSDVLNTATNCAVIFVGSGNMWTNSTFRGGGGGNLQSGETIGIAWDATAQLIWFWRSTTGLWNNGAIGSQNPATGTGGWSTSSFPTMAPAVNVQASGPADTFVINCGQAAFINTIPSGFSAWNGQSFAVPTAAFPRVACPTAWNPADQSANIILSNSNLTATISTGATDNAVRSTKSHATSGKYYAEFTANFGAAPGADTGVGIATSTAVLTSVGATSTNALLCYVSGNIYFNGSFTFTNVGGGITSGVICMAIDLDNKTSWFRLNNGPWNNPNAGANPATNTGGNSISAVFSGSTAAYAIFTANYNANVPAITANFGATAFSFAVPSGFVAWG
jgi:hypothetical protein